MDSRELLQNGWVEWGLWLCSSIQAKYYTFRIGTHMHSCFLLRTELPINQLLSKYNLLENFSSSKLEGWLASSEWNIPQRHNCHKLSSTHLQNPSKLPKVKFTVSSTLTSSYASARNPVPENTDSTEPCIIIINTCGKLLAVFMVE